MKECWVNVYHWENDVLYTYGIPFDHKHDEKIPNHLQVKLLYRIHVKLK